MLFHVTENLLKKVGFENKKVFVANFILSSYTISYPESCPAPNLRTGILSLLRRHLTDDDESHGGQKRQLIRPRSNNFLLLVWNLTKLPHMIELASP